MSHLALFHTEIGISSFSLFARMIKLVKLPSIAVCDLLFAFMLYRFCHRHCRHHLWFCRLLALLLFAVSRVDEDCNPGWGDCGRPLRLLVFLAKDGELAVTLCSLATGLLGQTALGAIF